MRNRTYFMFRSSDRVQLRCWVDLASWPAIGGPQSQQVKDGSTWVRYIKRRFSV